MRRRTGLAAGLGVVAAVLITMALFDEKSGTPAVFHVTLADPGMYQGGIYTDSFDVEPGQYSFRFTPNGDSPEILSISMEGGSFSFHENFILNGTLHRTGMSEYYTWEYLGREQFKVADYQTASIVINPNGNLLGPVSVSIIR